MIWSLVSMFTILIWVNISTFIGRPYTRVFKKCECCPYRFKREKRTVCSTMGRTFQLSWVWWKKSQRWTRRRIRKREVTHGAHAKPEWQTIIQKRHKAPKCCLFSLLVSPSFLQSKVMFKLNTISSLPIVSIETSNRTNSYCLDSWCPDGISSVPGLEVISYNKGENKFRPIPA